MLVFIEISTFAPAKKITTFIHIILYYNKRIMKIRKFMAMMIAAIAVCVGFASCGDDDDDESVIPTADTSAGKYTGEVTITVMGSDSKSNGTYEIKKIDDTHVSMTTPASGEGAMAMPALTVNNIPVTTSTVSGAEVVSASMAESKGTITVNDVEKAYTFSNIVIKNSGKKISIVYSLQYGKMPMTMEFSFTGEK